MARDETLHIRLEMLVSGDTRTLNFSVEGKQDGELLSITPVLKRVFSQAGAMLYHVGSPISVLLPDGISTSNEVVQFAESVNQAIGESFGLKDGIGIEVHHESGFTNYLAANHAPTQHVPGTSDRHLRPLN